MAGKLLEKPRHWALKGAKWLLKGLQTYLEDLFLLAGCALILIGTYQLSPLATWFVGGGMCLLAGILIGLGARRPA